MLHHTVMSSFAGHSSYVRYVYFLSRGVHREDRSAIIVSCIFEGTASSSSSSFTDLKVFILRLRAVEKSFSFLHPRPRVIQLCRSFLFISRNCTIGRLHVWLIYCRGDIIKIASSSLQWILSTPWARPSYLGVKDESSLNFRDTLPIETLSISQFPFDVLVSG